MDTLAWAYSTRKIICRAVLIYLTAKGVHIVTDNHTDQSYKVMQYNEGQC